MFKLKILRWSHFEPVSSSLLYQQLPRRKHASCEHICDVSVFLLLQLLNTGQQASALRMGKASGESKADRKAKDRRDRENVAGIAKPLAGRTLTKKALKLTKKGGASFLREKEN